MTISTSIIRRWAAMAEGFPDLEKAFDEWLDEHDRHVAEGAWDEGFGSGELSNSEHLSEMEYEYGDYVDLSNPYRKGEA